MKANFILLLTLAIALGSEGIVVPTAIAQNKNERSVVKSVCSTEHLIDVDLVPASERNANGTSGFQFAQIPEGSDDELLRIKSNLLMAHRIEIQPTFSGERKPEVGEFLGGLKFPVLQMYDREYRTDDFHVAVAHIGADFFPDPQDDMSWEFELEIPYDVIQQEFEIELTLEWQRSF